ncbi:MAG: diaminopimelate epimerase [Acidobacteria bacterium]|nr:diaminopimelate epimerase [Acidobacteriota bacterium]
MIDIAKAHAFGNDFLFVPAAQVDTHDLPALARLVCARHTGIGADGLILYSLSPDGSARMRLFNADGSPSELSGNGLRCLAALILHQLPPPRAGDEPPSTVRVDTDAGWKTLQLTGRTEARFTFRASMGHPTDLRQETIDVLGEALSIVTLGMGNPQCVQLVDRLPDVDRFERLGPALATHPRFPSGTNVEFAIVEAPGHIRILIWERGVGPTLASGTGACAAAVAAMRFGGAAREVDVDAPGGTQRVEWRDDGVFLTGWAEIVLEGQWTGR